MCNTNSSYRQNRPKRGGICVANHTSPIDIVILANDGCYAMVSETEITLQCSGSQILVFALFIQVCTGLYALLSSLLIVCCAQQVCSFTWYDLYNMIDTSEYDFNYNRFHIKQTNNFRTLGMAYINHIDYFDGTLCVLFLELKANYYAPFYNM